MALLLLRSHIAPLNTSGDSEVTKLFKKIPDDQLRSVRYEIRLTAKEAEAIQFSASIRQMSVAEFMRRAALGRRADVRYEVEIVIVLRDVVAAIRLLYAALVERGITPPKEAWGPLIDEACAAMRRITK